MYGFTYAAVRNVLRLVIILLELSRNPRAVFLLIVTHLALALFVLVTSLYLLRFSILPSLLHFVYYVRLGFFTHSLPLTPKHSFAFCLGPPLLGHRTSRCISFSELFLDMGAPHFDTVAPQISFAC